MQLNNIYLKKFKFGSPSTAYLIAMIFTMIFLVFMYRPGDVLAGDFRAWVDAALAMKNGEDPYASSGGFFKSGPVSPWYFYFYQSLILSDWFVFNSMQIINLLGVAYFAVFVFTPYVTNKQKLFLITIFVLLTSSVREILVDGQVTGIILGGFTYVLKQWTSYYGKKSFRFLLTFPVAIFLIDLKPNLTVPLFAILLFRKMYNRQIFATILLYFFSLTLVTGYLKYNISYLWIASLLDLNNAQSDSDLYGSMNIWQVLNLVTDNSQLKSVLLVFTPQLAI